MADPKITISAVDQTAAAIASVKRNLTSLQEVGTSLVGKFGSIGTAIVAAFSAGSIMHLVDMLDRLDDMAEKTGINTSKLSELRYAGEAVGTSQEQMASGLRKLAKNMADAAGGNEEAAAAFKALGIDVEDADGKLRGTDAVLNDLAQRFSGWADGPDKAAWAMKIFGKSGEDMIPMLNLGSAGLRSMANEANALGAVFSADVAKNAADFNDNLTKIKLASEGAAISMAGPLIKTLGDVSGAFIEARKQGANWFDTLALMAAKMPQDSSRGLLANPITLQAGLALQYMRTRGDALNGPKPTDAIQSEVNKMGYVGNAGRGTVNPAVAAPKLPSNNPPKIPKAPDHFADNFINGLINEYSRLDGEMTKTDEVTRALDLSTEKFTATQRALALEWAGKIDVEKADEKRMAEYTALQHADRAEKERNQAAVKALRQSTKDYVDAIREESDIMEIQHSMRGQASSDVDKAVAAYKIRTDLAKRLAEIEDSTAATDGVKKKLSSEARAAAIQAEKNAMADTANGYQQYMADIGTDAERLASITKNAFSTMEDAFVQYAQTGKFSSKDLMDSMIADLVRYQVQNSITKPLAKAVDSAGGVGGLFSMAKSFFFADGGIMSSQGPLPLHAYASGGIASGPQLALFGEGRMNEAYVPLPDGKRIPVNMQGNDAGSVTVNQPITINAPGAGADTVAQIQQMMPGLIAANAKVVEGVVRQAMARKGRSF